MTEKVDAEWVKAQLRQLAKGESPTPADPGDGEQVEIVELLSDVHRRYVSGRRALVDDARFLDSIVENIPHMIFVKDAAELRFVRFNKAGETLLGYDRTDLIGKNDDDFFPADEAAFFTSKDRKVLEAGELLDIPEEPIHTKTGERWLHTKKIPIVGDDGAPEFLLGISEDITERKAAVELLADRTRQLERSNAALERFAYVASHDLQEPLRTVVSYIQLLEREYGDRFDGDARTYLDFAVEGARRMQSLIRGLLTLARVQTAAKPFIELDLNAEVSVVLQGLRSAVSESGATIEVGELPQVLGDDDQIRQLLQNVIGNAIKFARPGAAPIIEVAGAVVGAVVRVSVTDNGLGVPDEFARKVFDVFKRLHTHDEIPGTGIGLAICERIVLRHGGRIWVESAGEHGAKFVIELPAAG